MSNALLFAKVAFPAVCFLCFLAGFILGWIASRAWARYDGGVG